MSTRGAIGFRIDGKDHIAFNHWDSYPSGLGADILKQLQTASVHDLAALPDRVRNLILFTKDNPPSQDQITAAEERAGIEPSNMNIEEWLEVLQEGQGSLTPYITGEWPIMYDSHTFLLDSLFCEWAYIVNLDDGTLEVYKGFNTEPNGAGRYASQHRERDGEYYGVVLVDTVSLSDVAHADIDALVEKWERIGEEPEEDEDESDEPTE